MEGLKFQKMWEAADTFVFDIDTGSILPIMQSLPQVASFGDKHFLFFYTKGIGAAYYEEADMKRAAEAGLRDFSERAFAEKYFNEIKELLINETALYARLEGMDFCSLSNDELRKILQESVDVVVKNFGYYLASQPQCVSLIEKRIQEQLAAVVQEDDVIEAFTLLSTPTTINKIRREERDWLTLLLHFKHGLLSSEQKDDLLERHYRSYFLLNAADGHEPWSREYFQHKSAEDASMSTTDIESQMVTLDRLLQNMERQKQEYIREHTIPQSIVDDCNLLASIGHWRLEMRFVWMPGYYYDKFILQEVAHRFSVEPDLIRFATISEILHLFDGRSLQTSELEKRADTFLFVIDEGVSTVHGGDEARKVFGEYVPALDLSNIRELKGNIAMKGRVHAKALVYQWGENMQEKLATADGDFILVAGQTRPQLMPLIVKSKGIVTDEGGITSHAAIVSRELKIPCVIGTKHATQIIKTGDMIILDADNGLVVIER